MAQVAASQPPLGPDPHAGIRLLCPMEHKLELETKIHQGAATADLQGLLIAWLYSAQAASVAHSDHLAEGLPGQGV